MIEERLNFTPQFEKRGGLLPCIAQEKSSGEILMLGYVSPEALEKTRTTGMATFYSTSRKALWTKGETSGEFMKVLEILTDCDQDALVYQVELLGQGVCHTKDKDGNPRKSCFYRKLSQKEDLQFLKGRQ